MHRKNEKSLGSSRSKVINEDLTQQYERDGAVCCRNVIDATVVADLERHIDALIRSDENRWTTHRENGGFSVLYLHKMAQTCARIREVNQLVRLPTFT